MKFSAVFVFFALISTALATPTNGNDLARRRATCPLRVLCINFVKCNRQFKICTYTNTIDVCGMRVRGYTLKTKTYCDSVGYVDR